MSEMDRCEHCGELEESETQHRACRLKAAFPGAATEHGDGLVSFDIEAIRKSLGWNKPIDTPQGVRFEFRPDGEVWIEVQTLVGNNLGAWSWFLSPETWQLVMDGYAEAQSARPAEPPESREAGR